ncbi:BamA/TamA family outer membrane protein [Pontibacter sp. G13]|uniref:BamA/TamA family outer membrane protein n=1 Tax=Pontibacter sp. G13 TaxID=3074898 RepID=UPI002889955C|nr:BamA/TamA family outer membrane protein [Pontibacter sp. G13]WNJ20163.1 BamA/TamA family outer membrane protein [Pontibacter sp. G13]
MLKELKDGAPSGVKYCCLLLLMAFGCPESLFAQDPIPIEDTLKVVTGNRNQLVALPVIFYTPETELAFGVTGMYLFVPRGNGPEARPSFIQFVGYYSLNNQFAINAPYELRFQDSKHVVKGSVDFFRRIRRFWGIGPYTPQAGDENYSSNYIRIRGDYLTRITPMFRSGLVLRYHEFFDVEPAEPDGQLASGDILGSEGGRSVGLGVIFNYDRRDNSFAPTTGPYLETSMVLFHPWMGSDFRFLRWEFDGRHYIQTFGRQVFAFQGRGIATLGDAPFENIALLGHQTINRGYFEGRFRDQMMGAIQAEYRIPLFRGDVTGRLPIGRRFGINFFGALANVSREIRTFTIDEIKYSFGSGIRFLLNQQENVTLRLDFAWGRPGNSGIYFMVGEAF